MGRCRAGLGGGAEPGSIEAPRAEGSPREAQSLSHGADPVPPGKYSSLSPFGKAGISLASLKRDLGRCGFRAVESDG
jgi:hypothetical protein